MTSPPTVAEAVSIRDEDGSAVFSASGVDVARYVYLPDTPQFESPKPYLHPIRTVSGRVVSLFRPHDHVWHKGLAWSLPNVGAHNFWGGPTYTRRAGRYEQLPNNGSQDHRRTVAAATGPGGASFGHDLVWHAESGTEVFRERRILSARVLDDDAWALGWSTTMTNVSEEQIRIGSPTTEGRDNAGYGGLFWRGPRSFTDGTVIAPDGAHDAEELRGTRHEWLAFVGEHDGDDARSTILMLDGGRNPGGMPAWFVRSNSFGCMNPAPFFGEELAVPAGESISFDYATVVADGGSDLDRAKQLAEAGRVALDLDLAARTEGNAR